MHIALKENERIRQIYRQSPWVLLHATIITVALGFILGSLLWKFSASGPLRIVLTVGLIAVLLHFLKVIIIWRLNQYVVTNQRLLHYGQKGLFDQLVVETPHERILNVSYKTEGMVSRIVGYGDVVVQVVGLMEPIVLRNIDQPMEIKDYLWEMHKRLAKDKGDAVYGNADATHIQEQVGYTKNNHT